MTNLSNPNPNFKFVSVTDNSASSYYDALQLQVERRLSRGLQLLVSYTLSHSIDNSSTDAFANYLNTPGGGAYQDDDRGDSDFDIRHSFSAGLTYNLPTPGSQKFVRAALGDWSLDSFVLARSAPPDDIIGAIYEAAGIALAPRPNVNPGVPLELFGAQYPGGKIFDKAAFAGAGRPAGQFRAQCPTRFWSLAGRRRVAAAISRVGKRGTTFPRRVL